MARGNQALVAFNRGLISPLGLTRVDLKRQAFSAEIQNNWMPRTLGSMMLRPGLGFIDESYNSAYALYIPFIFDLDDTAIIELTDSSMRVRVDEEIIQRVGTTTVITNGNFNSDLASWTDDDESGATSAWATGGYMSLTGTGFNSAIREQALTVSGSNVNKEHALRVVVTRGPVTIRVGSTSGADDYIAETILGTGIHSLTFTPTTNVYLRFANARKFASLIDSVAFEAAGDMVLTTPWTSGTMPDVRQIISGDEIFCASFGLQQRIIQRHSTNSWSIILYEPEDGPFRAINISSISLTPSATSGDITLSASNAFFKTGHVGALFKITSTGQTIDSTLGGADQFSDPVRISGLEANSGRRFHITIAGTFVATLTLQRSVGDVGAWVDIKTWTSPTSEDFDDGFDNQIIFYRIGIKPGNYTSGSADITMDYAAGGIDGILKVLSYSSSTSVTARVITSLGGTTSSINWYEGQWSDYRGWPSANTFHEGRLWWVGHDKINGSVSDAFSSFDDSVVGDSGPISRSIGSGPVDSLQWMLSLIRLQIGGQMAEFSAMTSTLDEPLTPTSFNLKSPTTQGSAPVQAIKVDNNGIFVQRSNTRVMGMQYDTYSYQYTTQELSVFCPEIGEPSIVRMAVQRKPDTRIHLVRSDGVVAVLLYDKVEDVSCFVTVETDGFVEDVLVMPGGIEDIVYYSVRRIINGVTKRYLEKWALESECRGATISKLADCHTVYSGSPTTTISGLDHLEAKQVVVWADGQDQGLFTVSSGSITLPVAVSNAVVGLYYEAIFKSTKLAYFANNGTALTMQKKVDHLGVILMWTHAQGLEYGRDEDHLDPLPQIYQGGPVDQESTFQTYDDQPITFPGAWDTDSRLWLKAAAPRSCTILGGVIEMETND